MKAIISGGGTGGHIFPAISIANAMKQLDAGVEILFVGATGRMEMERVPAAGYRIEGIPAKGLKRPLYSPANILIAIDYVKCLFKARKILKRFKPDIAIGVGGYASAAIVAEAAKRGIPVLLQEQNSFAGLVNRKNGKSAGKICVAYEGMERFFPKEKIVITGNPVRNDIRRPTTEQRLEGLKYYNLSPEKKTIFVVGGSLGCRTLNECMKKEIESGRLIRGGNVQFIWQCGKYYKAEIDSFMKGRENGNVFYSDFIQRMDLAYAAADIVISRAGAGTISELAIAGKCTIFVPSPMVAEDHQTHNAMALVKKDAAAIVKDSAALESLMSVAAGLLENKEKRETFEKNILEFAKPDAAMQIARYCMELASNGAKRRE